MMPHQNATAVAVQHNVPLTQSCNTERMPT